MSLPPISEILSSPSRTDSPLAQALSILFEPSPVLLNTLEPQVADSILNSRSPPTSYTQLINIALRAISSWDEISRAGFIAGHPRIGETKNLSTLSNKEQGGGKVGSSATPPEVLKRLEYLNAQYEERYPQLRYITFVNGRSRAEIVEEMESMLRISKGEAGSEDLFRPVEVGGVEWVKELDRAVQDVGKIAKSRLGALGVE